MFWECHAVPSSIDKLLDQPSESLKLQDFLDESDLIQECFSQNQRLIDYLVQAHVMNELIGHVIQRPTDDNFRNAYVVSELLSGDFPRLQEALLERAHLDHFYSFLLSTDDSCSTASLNPILASYFSRILMTLIIRKPAELFTYFKSRPTFQEDFLRHLDTNIDQWRALPFDRRLCRSSDRSHSMVRRNQFDRWYHRDIPRHGLDRRPNQCGQHSQWILTFSFRSTNHNR